jgi:predicted O-linked N-acetylglucosamine transferase (SPINDLY family)
MHISNIKINTKDSPVYSSKEVLQNKENETILYSNALEAANSLNFENAFYYYKKLLEINPYHKQTFFDLGAINSFLGNVEESIKYAKLLIEIDHSYNNITIHLANTYSNLGYHNESINLFKEELNRNPHNLTAWSDFFLSLNYIELSLQDRIHFRNEFSKLLKTPTNYSGFNNQKIKIGYVSSDFRNHAVAYFIKGLITKHNNSKFDIYYYHLSPIQDEITNSFIKSGRFKECSNLSNDEILQEIRKDEIDILIDLNGFTQSNRLEVFLEKPACIQITWLGFLNSLGIPSIEYKISDSNLIENSFEDYYSEKIIKLDNSLVYDPPESYPPISNLPFTYNGFITFGYFNNLKKLNKDVLDAWSIIFKSHKNCKLLIIKSKYNKLNNIITTYLNSKGFYNIEFRDESSLYDLMKIISLVDIALDPFPHTGGATTAHSLWMGVPVLTIQGKLEFERISSSILRNLQLDSFICENTEEYIQKGMSLRIEELKEIRLNIRSKFPDSNDAIKDLESKLVSLYTLHH